MDLCIFMSNRCNLLCDYCAIELNQGRAWYLDLKQIQRGVDHYADTVPSKDKSLCYLGGEPLLKWELLKDSVRAIRRRHPEMKQHLYTNGVLLTPERFRFLRDHGVSLTLSFDGKRQTQDLHRVHYKRPERSSWTAVMKNIKGIDTSHLAVNLVVAPDTAAQLPANIKFMADLGFGQIDFNLDFNKTRLKGWTKRAMKTLLRQTSRLCRHLERVLNRGEAGFDIPNISSFQQAVSQEGRRWWHTFESLILGSDGHYFPCESLFYFPIESLAPYRLGNVDQGIDWKKQARLTESARRFVVERFGDAPQFCCPMNTYYFMHRAGLDPEPALRALMSLFDNFAPPLISLGQRYKDRIGTQNLER